MIEFTHKHKSAFFPEWMEVSRWHKLADYNFDRFNYKIHNVVYEKRTVEFREAYDAQLAWEKLTR